MCVKIWLRQSFEECRRRWGFQHDPIDLASPLASCSRANPITVPIIEARIISPPQPARNRLYHEIRVGREAVRLGPATREKSVGTAESPPPDYCDRANCQHDYSRGVNHRRNHVAFQLTIFSIRWRGAVGSGRGYRLFRQLRPCLSKADRNARCRAIAAAGWHLFNVLPDLQKDLLEVFVVLLLSKISKH